MTTTNDSSANRSVAPSLPVSRNKSERPIFSLEDRSRFERAMQQKSDQNNRPQNNQSSTSQDKEALKNKDRNGGVRTTDDKMSSENTASKSNEDSLAWVEGAKAQNGGGTISEKLSTAAPPGEVDAELKAQIDRIAAAIAEQRVAGKQPQFTVQLPTGLVVESAVLSRNAAGFIAILLNARPGALGLNDRRLLLRELRNKLDDGKTKVAEIRFAEKDK